MREEAAKYGALLELLLPRHAPEAALGAAYLRFADAAAAAAAAAAMHGRLFDGRTVLARYVGDDELSAVRDAAAEAPEAAAAAVAPEA